MKAVIDQSRFKTVLRAAHSISLRVSPVPVYTHVHLEADESGLLRGMATDQDTWIETRADCSAEGTLTFCIPTEALTNFVSGLPDRDSIELSDERNGLRLRCARSTAFFSGLDPTLFPKFTPITTEKTVGLRMTSTDVRKLFGRTIGFASNDTLRQFVQTGIHLFTSKDRLVAEASSATGMARMSVSNTVGETAPVVVPGSAVQGLMRLLPKEPADVFVLIDRNWVGVETGPYRYLTKVFDEHYPNLEAAMPESCASDVCVETTKLREAITRLLNLAVDKDRTMRFVFSINGIAIATRDKLINQGEDHVEASLIGPEVTRALNGRVLLQAISGVGEHLQIGLVADGSRHANHVVLRDPTEPGWIGVAMALLG